MHYLRNIEIRIKTKIKQTWGLTEIATLKFWSKRNPPVKPRWARSKTTRNGCQSPTSRVTLKLGLGWYRHSVIKVSHSLIAVGAVGVRVPLYLGHSGWKVEPNTPFAALSFLYMKKVFIYCWIDRVFQSSPGKAQPRARDLMATSAP